MTAAQSTMWTTQMLQRVDAEEGAPLRAYVTDFLAQCHRVRDLSAFADADNSVTKNQLGEACDEHLDALCLLLGALRLQCDCAATLGPGDPLTMAVVAVVKLALLPIERSDVLAPLADRLQRSAEARGLSLETTSVDKEACYNWTGVLVHCLLSQFVTETTAPNLRAALSSVAAAAHLATADSISRIHYGAQLVNLMQPVVACHDAEQMTLLNTLLSASLYVSKFVMEIAAVRYHSAVPGLHKELEAIEAVCPQLVSDLLPDADQKLSFFTFRLCVLEEWIKHGDNVFLWTPRRSCFVVQLVRALKRLAHSLPESCVLRPHAWQLADALQSHVPALQQTEEQLTGDREAKRSRTEHADALRSLVVDSSAPASKLPVPAGFSR